MDIGGSPGRRLLSGVAEVLSLEEVPVVADVQDAPMPEQAQEEAVEVKMEETPRPTRFKAALSSERIAVQAVKAAGERTLSRPSGSAVAPKGPPMIAPKAPPMLDPKDLPVPLWARKAGVRGDPFKPWQSHFDPMTWDERLEEARHMQDEGAV